MADIKSFLDGDASAGAGAARALVTIEIANGKDALLINTDTAATALSGGGLNSNTFIGQGPGDDEFFIKANAASVVIDDLWDKSSIIFENTVRIVSIVEEEVNAQGQVGQFVRGFPVIAVTSNSVTNYVVTLSSGNTITIWDVDARTALNGGEQRYEFLHENDDASGFKTARGFFNAYKDGFAPNIEPTTIEEVRTLSSGNGGFIIVKDPDLPKNQLPPVKIIGPDGVTIIGNSLAGTYGSLTVANLNGPGENVQWNYFINNIDPDTLALAAGEVVFEEFMLIAGNSANSIPYTLRVTITGVDDGPQLISSFGPQMAAVGEAVSINLNDFIKDPDVGDRLNLMVRFLDDQGNPLPSNHGLSYNSSNQTIEGVPTIAGTYLVDITAVYSRGTSSFRFPIEVEAQPIGGDNAGSVVEDNPADTATGSLTPAGLTITLVDNNDRASNSGVEGTYGTMTFDPSSKTWTYTLDNTDADTNALKDTPGTDVFTFTATGTSFDVTITVAGANDAPVLSGVSLSGKRGTVGQAIEPITDTELNSLFSDPDTGDVLALRGDT